MGPEAAPDPPFHYCHVKMAVQLCHF
jgi:hypothetical protein